MSSNPPYSAVKRQSPHGKSVAIAPLPPKPPTVTKSSKNTTTGGTAIESEAGVIAGQYSCVFEGVNGDLYAGSKALYFVGTYFLFDKIMRLPWEFVRQVVKLDQGIRILTKQDEMHTFVMSQPTRVWTVLVSLHNDALLDRPPVAASIFKRRNSDPAMPSMRLDSERGSTLLPPASGKQRVAIQEAQQNTSSKNKNNDPKKQEIVVNGMPPSEVKEVLGEIRLSIPCTHNTVPGTLYGCTKGLYFYGKRFFWDVQKVFFEIGSIRQLRVDNAASGIRVTKRDGQQFLFESMENPDRVWATLLSLHNEILTKRARMQSALRGGGGGFRGTLARGSFVRMNSDPNMSRFRDDLSSREDDDDDDDHDDDDKVSQQLPAKSPQNKQKKATQPTKQPPPSPGKVDLNKEWADSVAKKKSFSNLVIEKLTLKCSLDEFHETFFADNAEYSMSKFLESRGDTELDSTPWKAAAAGGSGSSGAPQERREINYKHPVNAPLAPPEAGARKEQNLTRFGDLGMCLDTRTIVNDVPMADCFHVDDRVRVAADGPNAVVVSMEFQITFVKSTMFKSIITKTTSSEFSNVLSGMGDYMVEALGGPKAPPAPKVEPTEASPSWLAALRGGATGAAINPLLMALVILLQLYIVQELRTMRLEFAMMQLEIHERQQQQQQQLLLSSCPDVVVPAATTGEGEEEDAQSSPLEKLEQAENVDDSSVQAEL